MSKFTGVLAHYQARHNRPTDLIPADVADQLVQRMAAERISRRIIRMLPPDSVFLPARAFPQPHQLEEVALDLPFSELPGLRIVRSNPGAHAVARRNDAIAAISAYAWG